MTKILFIQRSKILFIFDFNNHTGKIKCDDANSTVTGRLAIILFYDNKC